MNALKQDSLGRSSGGTTGVWDDPQNLVSRCVHGGKNTWVFRDKDPYVILYEDDKEVFIVPHYRMDALELAALGTAIVQALQKVVNEPLCKSPKQN